MLLTNCKDSTPKVDESCTLELLPSEAQLTDDGAHESERVSPSQHIESDMFSWVRQMEDSIFEEPAEVFKLLNDPSLPMVDGLTYREIYQSQHLTHTLTRIRENAPIYQHLNKRKKSALMTEIGLAYMRKLNEHTTQDVKFQAESDKNQSQNECRANNLSPEANPQKIERTRTKPVRKCDRSSKNGVSKLKLHKKVRFTSVSFCKYFCSQQAPQRVRSAEPNSMQTC